MVLNLTVILRAVRPRPNLMRTFARPLVSTLIMAGATWAAYGLAGRVVSDRLATLAAIVAAVAVYLVLILATHAITREDILMFPKGEKLAKLLRLR